MDNASATPVNDDVVSAMNPYWSEKFFNSSALYRAGQDVSDVLDISREIIASGCGVRAQDVIFVGGGTEANNHAIVGVLEKWRTKHPGKVPHVVTSNIEHPSVRETLRVLRARHQIMLDEVPVDTDGVINAEILKEKLRIETALISVMYVNNEIGTIQPLREIAKTIRHFKKHVLGDTGSAYPVFHTDAIQAVNYLDIHLPRLGVDIMTISGAKIYGPKGIAGLVFIKDILSPIIFGGGQERGLRAGTPAVPLIVGLAKAFKIARKKSESEDVRLSDLRDTMIDMMSESLPTVRVNGATGQARIANNINISFPGLSSEQLVIELDARAVLASARAACSSDDPDESYVLQAIYPNDDTEQGSLRFTLGRDTTEKDIETTVKKLRKIIKKLYATKKKYEK
ncbi:MAG: cysteine desulfurase [Candidatus Nomurabacteria bacterium]|nr:cysteine desulfurase [Candidatus Nomurabacteria bacterium]